MHGGKIQCPHPRGEDRLNAGITRLKEEHSKKEAEWATERQKHEQTTHTLRAQIGYSEKEKGKAVEDMNTMTRQAELLENKWKAEQEETSRLRRDLQAMTDTLRSKHNKLEEVTERASEEVARAKLIRRSADQNLVQALKSIKDLTTELGATQ